MPLPTTCPHCRAQFNLSDEMAGRKIRCGKCQEVFTVKATALRRRDEDLEDGETDIVEKPRSRSPVSTRAERPASRPAARQRRDEDRPTRRGRDRDEDEEERPTRRAPAASGSAVPWIVGGAVACLLVLVGGAIALVVLLRDRPADPAQQAQNITAPIAQPADPAPPATPPVVVDPLELAPPPPADERPAAPVTPPPAPRERPVVSNGEMTAGARDRVKKATVYIRVHFADGRGASGTGFFGASDAPNIILTNAHVVGMLAPDSRPPLKIEVFINSGEKDEKVTSARVLGVDRLSDLAVLDIGRAEGLPRPLNVKNPAGVSELDKVYVFGFPLGESLGKEITIRPSSVSSLRKKGGRLDKIQVNGGMDPGNSGGPVVDANGDVIGVAVSGIPGRMINFAIPGERVHTILNGRISTLGRGQPYFADGGKVAVPITVEMIDPRNRIKEVALETWTGNAPDARAPLRPGSEAPPEPAAGDSPRQRFNFAYSSGQAKGDVVLPEAPPGKVHWFQPVWVHGDGKSRWASASAFRLHTPPVERKPALLALRYQAGSRALKLTINNAFRVGSDDDTEVALMNNTVRFSERVVNATAAGATLNLFYRGVERYFVMDRKRLPSRALDRLRPNLKYLVNVMQVDGSGNLRQNTVARAQLLRLPRTQAEELLQFHEPIRLGLDVMTVPTPGRTLNALETWQTERMLGIDTPSGVQKAPIALTFTYLGQRKRNGRDEAVIAVSGVIRDRQLAGRASGSVLLDLTTGQISLAEVRTTCEMQAFALDRGAGKVEKIKAISNLVVRLERGL